MNNQFGMDQNSLGFLQNILMQQNGMNPMSALGDFNQMDQVPDFSGMFGMDQFQEEDYEEMMSPMDVIRLMSSQGEDMPQLGILLQSLLSSGMGM